MRILLAVKEVIACERLAISSLSAILKAEGHEVRAVVINPLPALPTFKTIVNRMGTLGTAPPANNQPIPNDIPKAVYEVVRNFRPDIIGYTMMTGEHATLLELNRKLKRSAIGSKPAWPKANLPNCLRYQNSHLAGNSANPT